MSQRLDRVFVPLTAAAVPGPTFGQYSVVQDAILVWCWFAPQRHVGGVGGARSPCYDSVQRSGDVTQLLVVTFVVPDRRQNPVASAFDGTQCCAQLYSERRQNAAKRALLLLETDATRRVYDVPKIGRATSELQSQR